MVLNRRSFNLGIDPESGIVLHANPDQEIADPCGTQHEGATINQLR